MPALTCMRLPDAPYFFFTGYILPIPTSTCGDVRFCYADIREWWISQDQMNRILAKAYNIEEGRDKKGQHLSS